MPHKQHQRGIAFCLEPPLNRWNRKYKMMNSTTRTIIIIHRMKWRMRRRWKIKPNKMIDSIHSQFNAHVLQQCVKSRGCHVKHVIVCMFIIPHLRAHRWRIVRQSENIRIYQNYTKKKERISSLVFWSESIDKNVLNFIISLSVSDFYFYTFPYEAVIHFVVHS